MIDIVKIKADRVKITILSGFFGAGKTGGVPNPLIR